MQAKRSQNQRTIPTDQKLEFLAQSDIFQHLNSAEISELDRITNVITCPSGRVFYRPGEKGTVLFLIKTGRVQLYHLSADGRKLITATLEAGACFGELPLIGQGLHTSFAEAIEDARIYVISKHDLEHLLVQKPAVTLALLQIVGRRSAELEAQLINTTFKGTPARLATLLLQLAHSSEKNNCELVITGVSQEELAERLGVYRETVSLALRDLKDAGTIELGRKHITICQVRRLEELAQG